MASGPADLDGPYQQGNMEIVDKADTRKPKRNRDGTRAYAYVLTLFDVDLQELEVIKEKFEKKNWKYVLGDEMCPTTGRQHYQGYVKSKSYIYKGVLEDIIGNRWNKIAKGTELENWKYCGKSGIIHTNIKKVELTKKEILVSDARMYIEGNKIYRDLKNREWDGGLDTLTGYNFSEIAQFAKYKNLVDGYTYLTGSETEMKKTLAKMYKLNGIKGIVVVTEKSESAFIAGLREGFVNDHNGRTLFWDELDTEVIVIKI